MRELLNGLKNGDPSPVVVVTAEEPSAETIDAKKLSRKRRAPESSEPQDTPLTSPVVKAQPLRQVRAEIKVNRCRNALFELYHDELGLLGELPSSLGGSILRDLPSRSDTEFLNGLGWAELSQRTTSALAEAALLTAELTYRSSNFRKQHARDSRAFDKTTSELELKITELSGLLERQEANAKRREVDMRLGHEAEMLELRNELRLHEVRLSSSEEKVKSLEEELALSRLEMDKVRAEAEKAAEAFKGAFLKSDEFGMIVAEKALGFLNVGFEGCVEQFKEAGFPPEGTPDFLNFDKILENLPPES